MDPRSIVENAANGEIILLRSAQLLIKKTSRRNQMRPISQRVENPELKLELSRKLIFWIIITAMKRRIACTITAIIVSRRPI